MLSPFTDILELPFIAGFMVPGGIPPVEDHINGLTDDLAGDGGYILSTGAVLDDAQPDNVRAMIETGREYGRC